MPKDAKKRTVVDGVGQGAGGDRRAGAGRSGTWWWRPHRPGRLLKSITATVLEAALEEEMTDHLGHPKHQAPDGGAGDIRNEHADQQRPVLTDAAGEVAIDAPRDRAGTFEPVIVKKHQRRLSDVDAVAISLYAKGLTTGEISAHFAEVYGASISKDTISRRISTS